MEYKPIAQVYAERRAQITKMIEAGIPRTVIAQRLKISRQRVYQITAKYKRRKGNGRPA